MEAIERKFDQVVGGFSGAETGSHVMHGKLADPSVEANFLGLLIAMFYFSEKAGAG